MESMAVKKMQKKGFVTVAQVADSAGVSISTVYYAIRNGNLDVTKVGSTSLISPSNARKFASRYNPNIKSKKAR